MIEENGVRLEAITRGKYTLYNRYRLDCDDRSFFVKLETNNIAYDPQTDESCLFNLRYKKKFYYCPTGFATTSNLLKAVPGGQQV